MKEHDVVHVQFIQDFALTPSVVVHGRLLVSPLGSDITKPPDLDAYPEDVVKMRRRVLQMADRVAVCSDAFAAEVAAFADLPLHTIERVPMGVDLAVFKPAADDVPGPPIIGFFKGFKPVYGPTVLVRAMPRVLARHPTVRFEMVGDGPQRKACQHLASDLCVENAVTWIDPQPHDHLPGIIGRWRLSVVPSLCESFCVAALESQAMEVPVVASRVGGLCETVRDGQTGRLVTPDDPAALADAIASLLDFEPQRRVMGQAGRKMVRQKYEWHSCLDRWEALYRHMVTDECTV
jgi:glycosyltransferase involved in cell wall biosynthesis